MFGASSVSWTPSSRSITQGGRAGSHRAIARDPAAADGSPPGADAVDLLAYMLGRISGRAADLAYLSDRARISGLMCERSYDALRADG
ncbi:DUF2514 family protein [Achromobacter sp. PAB15]|uniref:DUF2514 family protein n=1 Tax=Achromobacter sp. PAB15 TaxID=3233048 RepID=UPI003F8DD1A3